MANWRESGEVPDSEDEEAYAGPWDDDDDELPLPSLASETTTTAATATATATTPTATAIAPAKKSASPEPELSLADVDARDHVEARDDLPPLISAAKAPPTNPATPPRQILPAPAPSSSPLSDLSQEPVFEDLEDGAPDLEKEREAAVDEHTVNDAGSPPSQPPPAHDEPAQQRGPSTELAVELAPAGRQLEPGHEPGSIQAPPPRTWRYDSPDELALDQEPRLGGKHEWEDRQAAVRHQRSLRDRKPIQLHPYLLENAQYSTLVRSHGVRPVRAAFTETPPPGSRQQDEDSQEQDFAGEDDSQNTTGRIGPHETTTDESQQTGAGAGPAEDDAFDMFEMPLPLPPTTQHNADDMDNETIVGDDHDDYSDLPPLLRKHGVAPPPTEGSSKKLKRKNPSHPELAGSKKQKTDDDSERTPARATRPAVSQTPELMSGLSSSPPPRSATTRRKPRVQTIDPETISVADPPAPDMSDINSPPLRPSIRQKAEKRTMGSDKTPILKRMADMFDLSSSPPPRISSIRRRARPLLTSAPAPQHISSPPHGPSLPRKSSSPPLPSDSAPAAAPPPIADAPPSRRPHQSSFRAPAQSAPVPSPILIDSESEPVTSDGESDSSGSGSDIVKATGKRIRGVLPASYLRLDLQAIRGKAAAASVNHRRDPTDRSPDRTRRRGVAQPRLGPPSSSARPVRSLSDLISSSDGEEGDKAAAPQIAKDGSDTALPPPKDLLQTFFVLRRDDDDDDDDGGEAVEEDYIDPMVFRKRPSSHTWLDSIRPQKRSKTITHRSKSGIGPKRRSQPKITSLFGHPSKTATSGKVARHNSRSSRPKAAPTGRSRASNGPKRLLLPPRLSILDVIEPNAPSFLRIAARTATRRSDKGRASPTRKVIRLADRRDNIDVATTLSSWRQGAIPPRPFASVERKRSAAAGQTGRRRGSGGGDQRPALAHLSLNTSTQNYTRPVLPAIFGTGGSLVREVNDRGKTVFKRKNGPGVMAPREQHRPGQLETEILAQVGSRGFHDRKRVLDRLFKKAGRRPSLASFVATKIDSDNTQPPGHRPEAVKAQVRPTATTTDEKQKRPRKQAAPRHVDVDAPQYVLSDDPMHDLVREPVKSCPQVTAAEISADKLLGLGPYGTRYTHHFEVFPLDAGAFFRETTLLGSGLLRRVADKTYLGRMRESGRVATTAATFSMAGQMLRWGVWDDQVSSEFGILLDWALEQAEGEEGDLAASVAAIGFMLDYVMTSVVLPDSGSERSIVSRTLEALQAVSARFALALSPSTPRTRKVNAVEMCIRSLILAVVVLQISREASPAALMADSSFALQDLVGSLARTCVRALVLIGLDEVRKTYEDLGSIGPSSRERGLGPSRVAVHGWVVVMQTLAIAAIPRTGFWDAVAAAALPAGLDLAKCADVPALEEIWRTVFTLLPLGEFDSAGVLRPGARHELPVAEGWALPQRLLRRVFDLYRGSGDGRQPASLNEYCRALIGRCLCLVQQWGWWRKCGGVIGVIFDFFGARDLAHLRNEEALRSPQFLEELASGRPCLRAAPEDRCFHLFLKLLATAVQRLGGHGARNLVARTMPNHDRQYPRERHMRERDLAALRNHHDLLVTLYWAAPPEARPAPRAIERLVSPASSHREACLVSLRAWSQLARLAVARGDESGVLGQLSAWQTAACQQMLAQHDAAAADMQQQRQQLLRSLGRDGTTDRVGSGLIDEALIRAMVASNRAAALDVLRCSLRASVHVIRHAATLDAAQFAANIWQLRQVLGRLARAPPELDWSALPPALDTLQHFLDVLDQHAPEASGIIGGIEDAVFILDREIAAGFFATTRCIIAAIVAAEENGGQQATAAGGDPTGCAEQAIAIAARLTLRLSQAGVLPLAGIFSRGKYSLFDGGPPLMGVLERRFAALLVAMLLERRAGGRPADEVAAVELGVSPLTLWITAIVKPRPYLGCEHRLGIELRRGGYLPSLVPKSLPGLSTVRPNYDSNRDLFEFAISHMGRAVRDASSGDGSGKKRLAAEYGDAVRSGMATLKADLGMMATRAQRDGEHGSYVLFAREIVGLIKMHGSDLCPVDDFFYQINAEYSPSTEDPRLHVAGMASYGLRLGDCADGDGSDGPVVPQLFYYLYNNFKVAVGRPNGLAEEARMVSRGMRRSGAVLAFVLGKMIPAAVRAALVVPEAHPLLDVYGEALRVVLTGRAVALEVRGDDLVHVVAVYRAVLEGVKGLEGTEALGRDEAHVLARAVAVLNCLWPSVRSSRLEPAAMQPACLADLERVLAGFAPFARGAEGWRGPAAMALDGCGRTGGDGGGGSGGGNNSSSSHHIAGFADNIVADVHKNWICTELEIAIRAPGKGAGGGARRARGSAEESALALRDGLTAWSRWWGAGVAGCSRAARHAGDRGLVI